ncbi:MAG: hypothetical protein JRF63_06260 [Deltaproteobacteria bacterium]|nr:hypothetical protein [Deltaproteobacteria bacterium]
MYPTPDDVYFSFAVTNDSGGSHDGMSVIWLDFDGDNVDSTYSNVVSTKVDLPPIINGVDDGLASEWGDAETSLTFDASAGSGSGVTGATLRSVYTDQDVYFFATWTETTAGSHVVSASVTRKQWSFDGAVWTQPGNEDRAFFAFPIVDDAFASSNGCSGACHSPEMYTAAGTTWDVWHWKAARTAPTGTADEKWWDDAGRHSDQGQSAYFEHTGTEPTYQFITDPGASAEYPLWNWELVPFDSGAAWASGDTIPGVVSRMPSGSRADVTAEASFDDGTGTWTLEIKRPRYTGHGDDRQF